MQDAAKNDATPKCDYSVMTEHFRLKFYSVTHDAAENSRQFCGLFY